MLSNWITQRDIGNYRVGIVVEGGRSVVSGVNSETDERGVWALWGERVS